MFRLQEAENGGSRFLWDTGTHTLHYVASQPDLEEYYAMPFYIHCNSLISRHSSYILDSKEHTNVHTCLEGPQQVERAQGLSVLGQSNTQSSVGAGWIVSSGNWKQCTVISISSSRCLFKMLQNDASNLISSLKSCCQYCYGRFCHLLELVWTYLSFYLCHLRTLSLPCFSFCLGSSGVQRLSSPLQ